MKVHFNFLCLSICLLLINNGSAEKRYCNEGLGECTIFSRCSNLTTFNDGKDHLNVRFNIELETDLCHYLEICCDPEDVLPETTSSPDFDYSFVGTNDFSSTTESALSLWKGESGNYVTSGGTTTVHAVSSEDRVNTDEFGQKSSEDDTPVGLKSASNNQNSCDEITHECIPYFYCSVDHTTDGADILATRVSGEGTCVVDSQVCCNKKDNIQRFKPQVCGLRQKDGIGYSVTNSVDEAQYAEFPWMAALTEILPSGQGKYICGGSLINPNVVLTAAHCVFGKDETALRVRLGEWDTQTTNEILPHSDHEVLQIILHSEFGASNLFNDYALLVLKNPAQLSAHVNTICLPPQNFKFDSQQCLASGWGTDKFGHDEFYRVNLKKLELPVVPLRDCQENLRTTRLGARFKIHTNFLCAGGERDVDTCTGDGGSPLVCPVPGRHEIYYQAGIVAWGIECGTEGVPGVYANVAKARTWIDEEMNNLGFGTSSYSTE